VMALLADVTREENRMKAMATMGMSIGVSFAVAFSLGPWLTGLVGISGLFWVTTIMGLAAISMLFLWRVCYYFGCRDYYAGSRDWCDFRAFDDDLLGRERDFGCLCLP